MKTSKQEFLALFPALNLPWGVILSKSFKFLIPQFTHLSNREAHLFYEDFDSLGFGKYVVISDLEMYS